MFRIDGSSWGVVLADVSGKGAAAAAYTGMVRFTLRTLAAGASSPRVVLQALNTALLRDSVDDRFCTLVFAIATVRGNGLDLRLALAGHHPPLLRRRNGQVEVVGTLGTAIGLVEAPRLTDTFLRLDPGDLLCLFTDGLVEARRGDEQYGDQRAVAVLAAGGEDPEAVVDALADSVRTFHPGALRDDLTLLCVAARGASGGAQPQTGREVEQHAAQVADARARAAMLRRQASDTSRVGTGSRTGRTRPTAGSGSRPRRGMRDTAAPWSTRAMCELHSAVQKRHLRRPTDAAEHPGQPLVADAADGGGREDLAARGRRASPTRARPGGGRPGRGCRRRRCPMRAESTWSGRASGASPHWCTRASVDLRGGDGLHALRGSSSTRLSRRSCPSAATAASAGATRPRTAVEKAASRIRPPTTAVADCEVGLDLLHPVEQVGAPFGQALAVVGEQDAAALALEHGRTGLALELLDLLRDGRRGEPHDLGRGDDRPMGRARRAGTAGPRDRSCRDATWLHDGRVFAGAS